MKTYQVPLIARLLGRRGKIHFFKAIRFQGDYWILMPKRGWIPCDVLNTQALFKPSWFWY